MTHLLSDVKPTSTTVSNWKKPRKISERKLRVSQKVFQTINFVHYVSFLYIFNCLSWLLYVWLVNNFNSIYLLIFDPNEHRFKKLDWFKNVYRLLRDSQLISTKPKMNGQLFSRHNFLLWGDFLSQLLLNWKKRLNRLVVPKHLLHTLNFSRFDKLNY